MTQADTPLRSVHTSNFPELLTYLGTSLVVSTYQAGKLIVLRADGSVINTHFRSFNQPMGLAADAAKLAIGTAYQIWELRNVPAVTQKIEPQGLHDACYLPRRTFVTGDIDIHEMSYIDNQLWFVNTRFSCLCTLDADHSFVTQWRPTFVTAFDLGDRCHLNGLGVKDNQPKYATALGETDTPGGWRENKASGGVLIDIPSNQILCRGLSMPHSPRWYGGKLWILESGQGSLAVVDPQSGSLTTVAQVPGFTRGLDFYGQFAFIGVSQIRETAVFGGLPITQRLQERCCGVWVVHIETGEIIAFLRFEEAVQEIFAIVALPNIRFPEIIDWDEKLLAASYVLPDAALKEVVHPVPQETPQTADHFLTLGNQAYHQGDLATAQDYYQRCLSLEPNHLEAQYNLGVVYVEQEQWEIAQQVLEQLLKIVPDHAAAYNNLGIIQQSNHRLPEAVRYYRQAISLRPDLADAHFNLGMALLQTGDYHQGFAECEWRWQTRQFTPFQCPHPKWDGTYLAGTLLVHTEQGSGDAIQFIRYLPLARSRCQRIILVCIPDLIPLFATISSIDKLVPPGEIAMSEFQAYIPLMSLPHIFCTTLATIPAQVPYLQVAKKHLKIPHLKGSDTCHVGIVWAGSPTHRRNHHRSCTIKDFLPILRRQDISFFSLQKGPRAADLGQLPPDIQVEDLSSLLGNFADTAYVINQLDLVISVDTSVVHLAGALGKPTWNLLDYSPDWRWLLGRQDSPWYPTMRLFRQPQPGDWAGVFQQVAEAVANL